MCDVQQDTLELWWRAPLKVQVFVHSGVVWVTPWGWGVLSTFGARGSSLIVVGLLLSSYEGFHSTYFSELSLLGAEGLLYGVISWGAPLQFCHGDLPQFHQGNPSVILACDSFSCYSLGLLQIAARNSGCFLS